MSFTEDELQSFNTILEQRLSAHRREMERVFDQRMNEYRRELDQRLVATQQDTLRTVSQKLTELQSRQDAVLSEKLAAQQIRITQAINNEAEQRQQQFETSVDRLLTAQQTRIIQAINNEAEQRQQQFETSVDRLLSAQLLGIEQLLSQQLLLQASQDTTIATGVPAQLEAIELQTELPWEDLMDVIGKALDDRLSVLNDTTQRSLKNLEQYLSVRLHSLRDEFIRGQGQAQGQQSLYNGNMTSIQEVLHGIEHLERIIESLQVAMTANHALLSNRLFHHQQLPLERAHAAGHTRAMPNGASTPLSIAKERVAHGLEPEVVTRQAEIEEQKES